MALPCFLIIGSAHEDRYSSTPGEMNDNMGSCMLHTCCVSWDVLRLTRVHMDM